MKKNPDKIVLLRGLGREAGHWGESLKMFKKFFPDSQIFTPDLPGAGINHKGKVPLGIKNFIPLIRKQVDLKENENNIIMGLSLGGMCTMEWIKQYPKDFKGAVIMNSSFGDLSLPWQRMKLDLLFQMAWAQFHKKEQGEAMMLEIVSNNSTTYPENVKIACDLLKIRPMKFESLFKQLLSGAFYQMKINEAPTSILALGSSKDKLVSSDCSVSLGKRLNCQVRLHPWAGHELPMDDAEWVCEQVKNWWQNI